MPSKEGNLSEPLSSLAQGLGGPPKRSQNPLERWLRHSYGGPRGYVSPISFAISPNSQTHQGSFSYCVGGIMDTMETIEVASGLSTEVKMLVAVCVVLATMLVLTMVSRP